MSRFLSSLSCKHAITPPPFNYDGAPSHSVQRTVTTARIVRHPKTTLVAIAPYEMMACKLRKSELTFISRPNQKIVIVSSTSTSATESNSFTRHTYVPCQYPKHTAHTNLKNSCGRLVLIYSDKGVEGEDLSSCVHFSTHRLRHRVIPPGLQTTILQ